jgi:hypothetical protein
MKRLNPDKLHVAIVDTISSTYNLPRRYTLTHSDITGDLFLTISNDYDRKKISKLYTRLMRDEVIAELINNAESPKLRVHCHVSGGIVFGTAKFRYKIFHSELLLAMEAIRYGDRKYFEKEPELDQAPVRVYFHSHNSKYNKIENWGVIADYK